MQPLRRSNALFASISISVRPSAMRMVSLPAALRDMVPWRNYHERL